MITHKEFFGYEHPILCAAMTCVTDIKLALACAKAGIIPSLTTAPTNVCVPRLDDDLTKFRKEMGHCKLVLGLAGPTSLGTEFEDFIVHMVKKHKITHVEKVQMLHSKNFIRKMHDLGCLVINKHSRSEMSKNVYDAHTINGTESAGYGSELNLNDLFIQLRHSTEERLIPSGGIATKEQIDYYIQNGALAVCIGTLFAASEESRVAKETKQEMIERTSQDLRFLSYSMQRGIIYKDENDVRSRALRKGVEGDIKNAHIFAGTGIDHIKEILPVQEIVNRLVYQ
jgi:NAD(P)H-dependent flavin oxidoreductase YrpB (nitropropane dioxygenase family)